MGWFSNNLDFFEVGWGCSRVSPENCEVGWGGVVEVVIKWFERNEKI